jgi:pimeloyl-ACP methyl ester carboxylesterase
MYCSEVIIVKQNQPNRRRAVIGCLIGCVAILVLCLALGYPFIRSTLSAPTTIEISPHHPFRSPQAKERYLSVYDQRAEDWPVPPETRMVHTSYGETFVRISGLEAASPLVLLHGAGGHSLQWMWNVEALSAHYRVYALDDITGHGRSVYTRSLAGPGDYTSWLDEVFDALDLGENIRLMGLSYGGWQSAQYALRFPDRLDKVVLLAPAGTVLPLHFEWIARAALTALPHRIFARSFVVWLLEDWAHQVGADREVLDQFIDDAYLAGRSFKPPRLANPTVLTDAQWRSIRVPVLYLVGENEKIYDAQEAVQRLNDVAPDVETHVIPDAGHDLTIVQADLVHKKVLEFLGGP